MNSRFGLIVVGDEILSGRRTDRHFAQVVSMLAQRGLSLAWCQILPDERPVLVRALRAAQSDGDIVFSCGGIGATPDDHTRQAAAEAYGVPIELHPEAARLIAERCAELGAPDMTSAENLQRLKMGEFPRGARLIPNPYNRIPGFSCGRSHFVPGFPVMAWPMLEWVLDTEYAALAHTGHREERTLLVFDTAESTIAPLMEEIERRFAGVRCFSLPSVGDGSDGRPARRHIELGVKGPRDVVLRAFEAMVAGIELLGRDLERQPAPAAPGPTRT